MLWRQAGITLTGEILPAVAALLAVPLTIHYFGLERFGFLSLAWVMLTYAILCDFGCTRTTIKFVAEWSGAWDQAAVRELVSTSVVVHALCGLLAAAGMIIAGVWLGPRAIRDTAVGLAEVRASMWWWGATAPLMIWGGLLRGLLEAVQAFEQAALLKMFFGVGLAAAPVAVVMAGGDLRHVALTHCVIAALATFSYGWAVQQRLPGILFGRVSRAAAGRLLSFAGWFSLVTLVSGASAQLDRLMLAALRPISAIGCYTPPANLVARLTVVPQSFFVTLLPIFAGLNAAGKHLVLRRRFEQSSALLMVLVGGLTVALLFLGDPLMSWWLGPAFAQQVSSVFKLLLVGFFANSFAWIPCTLLQASGQLRPVFLVFAIELPLLAGALWWAIGRWGIEGAAAVWAARGLAEALAFIWLAHRTVKATAAMGPLLQATQKMAGLVMAVSLAFIVQALSLPEGLHVVLLSVFLGVFLWEMGRSIRLMTLRVD